MVAMAANTSAKTVHIFPRKAGWVVRSDRWATMKGQTGRLLGVYSTQKAAVDAARQIVRRAPAGQIVVHSRNGSMRSRDVHGLPVLQTSPQKSKLGTKAIERAVSLVLRERLDRA